MTPVNDVLNPWRDPDPVFSPARAASDFLGERELLLLCAPLSVAPTVPRGWLDAGERIRGEAYRFAADGQRHLLAHGLKRWAISNLLNVSPRDLIFSQNHLGKPVLHDAAVHFSLSHSADWVAVALYREAPLGVDVEAGRSAMQNPATWPDITHPDEPVPEDTGAFLTTWTLKEAISKCSGEGLTMDFRGLSLRASGDQSEIYRATDGKRHWHAGHEQLDSNTHLAYASMVPWKRVRRRLVLSFGRGDERSD